ncbi:MAG: hypothetical protein NZM12_06300, partial [Steroidobacteraceae bacterium]|nr:hypothetical protein [Steroidobacteraceae bacterium]MDW8260556.1 hypothetical protein [Gammaproteobacteria bacterium]
MNDRSCEPSLRSLRPRQFDDLLRCGAPGDGGYVLPRRLIAASDVLLSLGVGADWSFESDVLELKPDIELLCVDGTTSAERIAAQVRSDLWRAARRLRIGKFWRVWRLRDRPQAFREFFARHRLLPKLVRATAGPDAVTLPQLLAELNVGVAARRALVKIDIEGTEYEVLESAHAALGGVTGLIVEFHALERHW